MSENEEMLIDCVECGMLLKDCFCNISDDLDDCTNFEDEFPEVFE